MKKRFVLGIVVVYFVLFLLVRNSNHQSIFSMDYTSKEQINAIFYDSIDEDKVTTLRYQPFPQYDVTICIYLSDEQVKGIEVMDGAFIGQVFVHMQDAKHVYIDINGDFFKTEAMHNPPQLINLSVGESSNCSFSLGKDFQESIKNYKINYQHESYTFMVQ